MAGVSALPGASEQMALIARLRWQSLRNSLRTLKGRLEFISLLLVGVFSGVGVLGAGVGLGFGAFALLANDKAEWVPALLWGVFLFWQLFPLIIAASTAQFDFRNLLRFPLRYSAFFLLTLAYGLFDAPAIASVFWLVCIAAGIGFARPLMVLWTLPVLLVFALVNLALGRLIFAWLERFLARRRTREVVAFLVLLGVVSLQLIGVLADRWGRRASPLALRLPFLRPVIHVLPPGLAGSSIIGAAGGDWLRATSSIALLAAYGAAFLWLLGFRLRAQYTGEDLGEALAPVARPLAAAVQPSWDITGFSGPVSAMFEKEVRYLFRSGPALLNLVIPQVIIVFFALSFQQPGKHPGFFTRTPDLIFPMAAGYAFLIQANLVFNSFAFDGRGIQLLLVAPVKFRDVLLGKNIFQGLVTLVETSLVGVVVSFLFRPPTASVVGVTLAALAFALPVNFSLGNLLSLSFPRKLDFGVFRQKRASGVTIAASLATQVALIGICGGVIFAARLLGRQWIMGMAFIVLAAAAWPFYVWGLRRCDRIALEKREVLTAELCRE